MGTGDLTLGGEDDHSLSSTAEFKTAWSYTSTPPYVLMAWSLIKNRANFTFKRKFPTKVKAEL